MPFRSSDAASSPIEPRADINLILEAGDHAYRTKATMPTELKTTIQNLIAGARGGDRDRASGGLSGAASPGAGLTHPLY
jgi:hypothetical protein